MGIITTAVGIDSHRGGNQFPPLAESQGRGGLLSGGLLSGGLLSGGLLSGVRPVAAPANFHRGAVADRGYAGGAHPPPDFR